MTLDDSLMLTLGGIGTRARARARASSIHSMKKGQLGTV